MSASADIFEQEDDCEKKKKKMESINLKCSNELCWFEREREWRIAYTAYFLYMLVVLLLQDKLDKVKVIISLGKREKCSLDEDNKVYGPREKKYIL